MRRAPGRSDAGESLVELLVTVIILGLVTSGLAASLLATGNASTLARRQAQAQNTLRSWAEEVGAAAYTDCAQAPKFAGLVPALPGGLTGSVTSVRYWDGTAFAATCGTDTGIQRVTLTITVANTLSDPLVRGITVVVRRPCVATC